MYLLVFKVSKKKHRTSNEHFYIDFESVFYDIHIGQDWNFPDYTHRNSSQSLVKYQLESMFTKRKHGNN